LATQTVERPTAREQALVLAAGAILGLLTALAPGGAAAPFIGEEGWTGRWWFWTACVVVWSGAISALALHGLTGFLRA
jgi:hypothetical protein